MAQNPIQKALADADVIQGAHRAMEHTTVARVLVLDRTALESSVRHNFGADRPEVDDYASKVLALFDRAAARGDGLAVYENHDLGHPEVGERQYASYGSKESQLETREGHVWGGDIVHCFVAGKDILPKQLPDIGGAINWRYQLVAVALPGATVTAEL